MTRFIYHPVHDHHLRDIINPAGQTVSAMDYDDDGRLTEVCDAEGACAQSSYDLQGRSVTQTDATQRDVQYTYDDRGNVETQTDALGHTVSFEYDADDNLTKATGPDSIHLVGCIMCPPLPVIDESRVRRDGTNEFCKKGGSPEPFLYSARWARKPPTQPFPMCCLKLSC